MSTAATLKEKFEKLPELAAPDHYDIDLTTKFDGFTFDGRVAIKLTITKATDFLKLHAHALDIKKASITLADGTELSDLKYDLDDTWMTLTVHLGKNVSPQTATLNIDFIGELNDKMRGFYRSQYKTKDGASKFLASTQFESTYARKAFPCWDEPTYKATFGVTLHVDKDHTALSNMNIVSESTNGDVKTVKFAPTPKMSSYLVAFAVGDLEFIESKTSDGIPVRVYTVAGKKESGQFALDISCKAIDWYNKWFDINYPLPKCDLIAIPDFSMGAMENWGLVTYREIALLVEPGQTSTKQKSYVALVVAHELAHFWFGDLVTMKWWTDLWLKEGFASFMEYLFVADNNPELRIWLHYLNDELARGLSLDALKSSHPIEVEIGNPNELDDIYDSITYAKSNSVNRQLCEYLSEPVFQKGLRIYLDRFKYSNAQTTDLWAALSEASGQNIAELMSSWTKQMGFPLVTLEETRRDGDTLVVKLSQRRFLADGTDEPNALWKVPINVSTTADFSTIKHRLLLTDREQEFRLDGIPAGEHIKLNSGTSGFYRVQYKCADTFGALVRAVSENRLPVLDRVGFTNDIFALVSSGRVEAKAFLSLLSAVSTSETECSVWSTVDQGLAALSNVFLQDGASNQLKKDLDAWIAKVMAPAGVRVGWEPQPSDDSQTQMMRAVVQGRLAKAGHQPTIDKALELFDRHVSEGTALNPDLRLMVFGVAGRSGSDERVAALYKLFETGVNEVQRHALIALGQSPNKDDLLKFFEYAVGQQKVRSQDLIYPFVGAASSAVGTKFVWNYFKDNLKTLLDRFGGANSLLFQHVLQYSCDHGADEGLAHEVETYFPGVLEPIDVNTLDRTIRQAVESIRLNAKLLKKSAPETTAFLSSQ